MADAAPVPVYGQALAYVRNGGVSTAQSFLKHSLAPLDRLVRHLPEEGTILDLGCGEGILANLVARALPKCRIIGYDRDAERLALAQRNAVHNARFEVRDIFDLPRDLIADGAILNDVVHHVPFRRHGELLETVLRHLREDAALVLKEVDRGDTPDRVMTTFFDSRLYPDDVLCYRTVADWLVLLRRLGMRDVAVTRLGHPWPASRTLMLARRPPEGAPPRDEMAARIGAANRACDQDTETVFLTGATGFIGGHLARRLLLEGLNGKKVRLVILVRDPERLPAELVDRGAVPLYGDLDDLPRLRPALEGVGYVFHLAAEVKIKHGIDIWRNNHAGTVALLDALGGLPIKRLVHASTMGAVDRSPNDPCTAPLDEGVPPHPLTEYGRAKLAAERAVTESGLPHTIVRITWGYGPGMTPDTHVRFLAQGVIDGKLFSRFNFPGRVSVIGVDDLVEALLTVAPRDDTEGEIYYVSDGRPIALGTMFKIVANLTGGRAGAIDIPMWISWLARRLRPFLPLALQNLNSDVLSASNDKIAAIGFRPVLSKRQAFASLVRDLGVRPGSGRRLMSLVTGAASGIGRALAHQLDAEGHRLLLIDRDAEGLQAVAAVLGAETLALDLTEAGAITTLENRLERQGYRLDWVINCAGIGRRGALVEAPEGSAEAIIDLNCRALTSISRLALRHFREEGTGVLVNIASSAAFQPLPNFAAYAASKAYVQSFTRALAGEARDIGNVLVITVNPSGTATGFQAAASVKQREGESLLAPKLVAAHVLDAIYRRRSELTIGRSGRAMALLARVLPIAVQVRLWRRLVLALR